MASTYSIRVEVTDLKHQPLKGAQVTVSADSQGKVPPVRAVPDERTGAHVIVGLSAGRYCITVAARGLEAQERVVEHGGGTLHERFVLGPRGAPHYYAGPVKVPFEPTGLLGVTLRPGLDNDAVAALDEAARQAKLTPTDTGQAYGAADAVRLYRLPPRIGEQAVQATLARLSALSAVQVAGLVLEATEHSATILTRQVVARFHPSVKDDEVAVIGKRVGVSVVRKLPYVPNGWLLDTHGTGSLAVVQVCDHLLQTGRVLYAEPNLVQLAADLQIFPEDWLRPEQWHLPVVNLPQAWETLRNANPAGTGPGDPSDLTFGSAQIVVAIMDRGIQSATTGGVAAAVNADFQGTVSSGANKVSNFFDFSNMVPNNDAPPNNHGMGCAGVAGARANNPSPVAGTSAGVVGAAPNCRLLGAIRPAVGTNQQYADAFVWMAGFNPGWTADGVNYPAGTAFPAVPTAPADIISNSYTWSPVLSGVMADMIDYLTSYGRGGRGTSIFWAAGNGNAVTNYGTTTHPKVFAVAASTLDDDGVTEVRAAYSNFGNAIEFCAPSHDAYVAGAIVHNPPASYGVISADLAGQGNMPGHPAQQTTTTAAAGPSAAAVNIAVASSAGFAAGQAVLVRAPGAAGAEAQRIVSIPNATTIRVTNLRGAHPAGTVVAGGPADYTNVFGGTSSATPLAAGIAALCLSANPTLSWVELRQILRTTAQRIDLANTNLVGQWIDTTGDGVPNFSQWYGWGRLDTNAAVAAARDYDHDVDLVVRDNLADDGTVPSGGWHAHSPDIWTDPNDVPIPALAYGSAPPHVTPVRDQTNYAFVRVRNFGTAASSDYWVRALISHYPGFEFRFPQEWTLSNLPGQPVPNPLVPGSYLIGEVAQTGLAPGASTIVKMTWTANLVPPDEVVVAGITVRWHPCLLAMVAPIDGPPPAGATFDVKRYNNLAHRNITIADSDASARGDLATAAVAGTSDPVGVDALVLDRSAVPSDYRVYARIDDAALMRRWLTLAAAGEVVAARPLPDAPAGTVVPAPERDPLEEPAPAPHGHDGGCQLVLLEPTRVAIRCCDGQAVVVHAPARTMFEFRCAPTIARPKVQVGRVQGQEVLVFDHGGASALELPMPLGGGRFQAVVLGLQRVGGLRGAAELRATQRRADGELSAGYTVTG
jgi:hypothetical protein